MIRSTYALGGIDIHGQHDDQGLTLCGAWASDIKPMCAGGTITCPDCDAIRNASESWAALPAAS